MDIFYKDDHGNYQLTHTYTGQTLHTDALTTIHNNEALKGLVDIKWDPINALIGQIKSNDVITPRAFYRNQTFHLKLYVKDCVLIET